MNSNSNLITYGSIFLGTSAILVGITCKFSYELLKQSRLAKATAQMGYVERDTLVLTINAAALFSLIGMTLGNGLFGVAEFYYHFHPSYKYIVDIGYFAFHLFYIIDYTCLFIFFIFRLKKCFDNTIYYINQTTIWILIFGVVLADIMIFTFAWINTKQTEDVNMRHAGSDDHLFVDVFLVIGICLGHLITMFVISMLFSNRLLSLVILIRKTTTLHEPMSIYHNRISTIRHSKFQKMEKIKNTDTTRGNGLNMHAPLQLVGMDADGTGTGNYKNGTNKLINGANMTNIKSDYLKDSHTRLTVSGTHTHTYGMDASISVSPITLSLTSAFNPNQFELLEVVSKQTLLMFIQCFILCLSHICIIFVLVDFIDHFFWNACLALSQIMTGICVWLSFVFSNNEYKFLCGKFHYYCLRGYQRKSIQQIKIEKYKAKKLRRKKQQQKIRSHKKRNVKANLKNNVNINTKTNHHDHVAISKMDSLQSNVQHINSEIKDVIIKPQDTENDFEYKIMVDVDR